MIEIEKPRIEALDLATNGTYGKFVVEPLERGYGTTIGNSLRRVLLSSLPGVAVTSIKIDGILHGASPRWSRSCRTFFSLLTRKIRSTVAFIVKLKQIKKSPRFQLTNFYFFGRIKR